MGAAFRRNLLFGLLAVLASSPALAQSTPSLDLRGFRPPTAPDSALRLEPTHTPGRGAWNVGAWFSYAHRPVLLEDASGNRLRSIIEHQFSVDYLASLGIGERLALGLTLPTVVYQTGDDVGDLVAADPLPRTALGDIGFDIKATLVPAGSLGGFGLAALGRITAPSGNERSYLGEGSVSGELKLLSELRLIALDVRAALGAKIRSEEDEFVGEPFGHDLPWAAGVSLRPQALGLDDKARWMWNVEVHGAVALTPTFASAPQSPVLAAVSARYGVEDVSLIAGLELPLNDAVGNPTLRPVLGFGWAPRFQDQDDDGIEDELDECPELAEDKDGFEDRDGCPDFDDDSDGVPDDEDRCPDEQEDEDGFQDDDGCPDRDNDRDQIPDPLDACPSEAGPRSKNPKFNGCPSKDSDADGVPDDLDRCPARTEDKDGHDDDDGCPDPDNDGDRVKDEDDACPDHPGPERSEPKLNGCPSPDRDGDTYDDAEDKCPDAAEDFNDVADDDGCPDTDATQPPQQRALPLVTLERRADRWVLTTRRPITLATAKDSIRLTEQSMPILRAISYELNRNPDFVVMVGVRPNANTQQAEQQALSKSFAIVHALRSLTHRDEVAETIGWSAVQAEPGARKSGVGFMVLAPRKKP